MPAVSLQLNDRSTYPQEGKIETISGVIDTSTGTVSLRAVFPNKDGLLTSGGSGNVIVPLKKEDCIVIPQAATYELQDKVFVYKEYIVENGLQVGDVIVVEGVGLLREGTPVVAKPASDNQQVKEG